MGERNVSVTAKMTSDHVRIAKIKASMGSAQEPSNIFITQLSVSLAAIGTIATHLQTDAALDGDALALEDKEIGVGIGLGCSIIAAVYWYIKNPPLKPNSTFTEEMQYWDTRKKFINPWFRRFKTATFFGNNVGTVIAEFLLLLIPLPDWIKSVIKLGLSNLFGWIIGLCAIFFLSDPAEAPPHPLDEKNNKPNIFIVNMDGWVRYTRVGMVMGGPIGAAIGAGIGLLFPPFGVAIGFAIGTALGAVIGTLTFAAAVPLINKIRYTLYPDIATAPVDPAKHLFRFNYIRVGAAFGAATGTLIACIVALCITLPCPFLFVMALSTAAGLLIGGVVIGVSGNAISNAINPSRNKTSSSWDYGARNTLSVGGQNGLGLALYGILCFFDLQTIIPNLKDLLCSACSIVCSLIGGIYDAVIGVKNRNVDEEKFKQESGLSVPWSQRAGAFFSLGGFTGGMIAFIFGKLFFPAGTAVLTAIGTGLGGIISFGISAKWGNEIYIKFAKSCTWLAEKLDMAPPPTRTVKLSQQKPVMQTQAKLKTTHITLELKTVAEKIKHFENKQNIKPTNLAAAPTLIWRNQKRGRPDFFKDRIYFEDKENFPSYISPGPLSV